MKKISTYIFTGLRDSGKTTIIRALMEKNNSLKIALIDNFSVQNNAVSATHLGKKVEQLVGSKYFDRVFIETLPLALPVALVDIFRHTHSKTNLDLSEIAHLENFICVVDISQFFENLYSENAPIFCQQIELADTVILNKIDRIQAQNLRQIHTIIRHLNPNAQILEAQFGEIGEEKANFTKKFNFDYFTKSAQWFHQSFQNFPNNDGVQVISFVEKMPFHPERLRNFFHTFPEKIIRSRAIFWVASRPDLALSWQQAGKIQEVKPMRLWWATMPESERIKNEEYLWNKSFLVERWDKKWGDRLNEWLFVGKNLNPDWLRLQLDECVCTPEELQKQAWRDDFPDWQSPQPHVDFKYLENFLKFPQ